MVRTLAKVKNRSGADSFLQLPRGVLNSPNYKKLSSAAVKLLVDIGEQYRGTNNGDLQCTFSLMKERGWKSSATLQRAKEELLHYGFISLTRQGGLGFCSLFAITWRPIDYCAGKLDAPETKRASGAFKEDKPLFKKRRKALCKKKPSSKNELAPVQYLYRRNTKGSISVLGRFNKCIGKGGFSCAS